MPPHPDPFCVCGHPGHRHSRRLARHATRGGSTVVQDFGIQCDGCECREFRDVNDYAFGRHPIRSTVRMEDPRRIDVEEKLHAAEGRVAKLEELRRAALREQWLREAAYHQQQLQPPSIMVTSDHTTPADEWVTELRPAVQPPKPAPAAPGVDLPAQAIRWVKRGGK